LRTRSLRRKRKRAKNPNRTPNIFRSSNGFEKGIVNTTTKNTIRFLVFIFEGFEVLDTFVAAQRIYE